MKRKVLLVRSVVVCGLLCVYLAGAQTFRGTVSDASGGVIPSAAVQLLVAGKTVASTMTSSRGEFTLEVGRTAASGQADPSARYTVSADANGFLPVSREVPSSEAASTRLALVLEVAPYRQSVDVSAQIPLTDTVLDMSGVRESAAKDVGEALTALDGVAKIRKAGIANDLVVRGFQQNNINVLVNGSRIYGACPNHMDPPSQHVDFAEVDHVEVTKGAFDVRNQGSLGAVVNIVPQSPGLGFRLKPSFSVGSFGYYNPSLVASYGNDTVRILGGYSFRRSDPYRDGSGRPFTDYAAYSAAGRAQQSFDINTGWVETDFRISDRQRLAVSYTRQQADLILYPYLSMDADSDNADRAMVRYTIRELPSSLRAVRIETYFTQVKHFMSDSQRKSAINGAWVMASNASTRAVGGRVEADFGRDFTAGFEAYYRNWNMLGNMRTAMATMVTPTVPDVDTQSVGSFLIYRHAITERLRLTGGARFDHASMRVTAANASTDLYYQFHNTRRTGSIDNYPSGNLRLSLTLPQSLELFAGVGTTGRIPDAEERYFSRTMSARPTAGNPLLPITRNTEASVGLNLTRGRFHVRSDLFSSYLNDFIIVNNQPRLNAAANGSMTPLTSRSYTNIGAHIYGGELGYGYSFTNWLSLAGGGSYTRGTASADPSAKVLSANLPEMPPLRGWAALRYAHRWAFAELGGVVANRQSLVDTDLAETPTPGYGLLNLKLGFTLRKLSGSFSMDNLLNRFYYEHLSYYRDPFASGIKIPEPGRNVFVEFRYSF